MSEEQILVPRYLSQGERIRTRSLYEAVFPEDSERFVDYYYQYKTRDNEILVLEQGDEPVSMLHLNPYTMIVNGYELKSNYIVAVATRKDCRHQGYMRTLLKKALRDMGGQKMPFTFLMPARESLYTPFDFVWICPHTPLPERVLRLGAKEQNRYLSSRYQMFCRRDERYMENLAAERTAETGEQPEGKIPPYMARITDVCQMLRLVRSAKRQELYLHIKDPIIRKNQGYFRWELSEDDSRAEKLEATPEKTDLELSIGEMASMVFGSFRICLSEMV